MTAVYENLGVRFLYPENWTIVEEQSERWPHTVSVQSPGGAFWTLHIYPLPINMPALLEESWEAMRGEYESLEHRETSEKFGEFDADGRDYDFFCLDFVITARVRGVLLDDRAFLLFYQAETREFDELEPVFRAMTLSLLQTAV